MVDARQQCQGPAAHQRPNPSAAALWCGAAGAGVNGSDQSHLVDAALDTLGTGAGEPPVRSTVAATIDRLVRSGLLVASARCSS